MRIGRRPLLIISALTVAAAVLAGCSSAGGQASTSTATPLSTALDVTTINGAALPVGYVAMTNEKTMLDTIDADGLRLVITEGTRPAGSRAAIHIHKYGGHTCVLSGVITDYIEGHEPMEFPAGTCYYMPPNTLMTATNLGTEDAVLIDTFTLPVGEPTITIREPGLKAP